LLIGLGAVATGAVIALQGHALATVAVPAAIFAGVIGARRPAAVVTAAVLVFGTYGTIKAFLPVVPGAGLGDALLLVLWIGVIYTFLSGRRPRAAYLVPGVLLVVLFVAVSLLAMVVSPDGGAARESFRLTHWHVLAVALIAFGPWTQSTFRHIAQGIVVVAVLIGAYGMFRYVVGPSHSELVVAHLTHPDVRISHIRFFGSFPSAQELCAWDACVIPFCFALLLSWRGRWRLLAGLALALSIGTLFASDVRTGLIAVAAALVVTTLAFFAARAFAAGRRLGTGMVTVLVVVGMAAAGYGLIVATSPQRASRISALFHPSSDTDYQIRQQRWQLAWDETLAEPFGHGLGTTGAPAFRAHVAIVGPPILDSSYLQIGIEQGPVVLALFALAFLVLLANLLVGGVRARDPGSAALMLGASGTLVSIAVVMYGSTFIAVPALTVGWVIVGLGAAQLVSGGVAPAPRRRLLIRTPLPTAGPGLAPGSRSA
jgi:hypothetical protein